MHAAFSPEKPNKKNNIQKLCSSEWNSKHALLNTKNDSIMKHIVGALIFLKEQIADSEYSVTKWIS